MIIIDYKALIGKRYSHLTFVKALPFDGRRRKIELLCDCGSTVFADYSNIKSGKTKSCGCRQHRKKWEGSDHPLRKIWTGIKQRCNNPDCEAYKYYGAKGVRICEEWVKNYPAFYKWCMANGWKPGLEIDKDIKGNGKLYSPEFCTIATHGENMLATKGIRVPQEKIDIILSSYKSARQLAKILKMGKNTIAKIRNSKYGCDTI